MNHRRILTVLGAEGAGKSTLCEEVARLTGTKTVVVPEWPSFDNFLRAPAKHAFDNQMEAMSGCLEAYERARSIDDATTILLELGPERVHLIYSSHMHELGYFTTEQWSTLQTQYEWACNQWPPNYIYLYADDEVIRSRLKSRSRKEDLAWNQQQADKLAQRWRALIASDWRKDKELLELPSDRGISIMADSAIEWLKALGIVDNAAGPRL
jgi:deoxyadenosine/deoxycytidine kinase